VIGRQRMGFGVCSELGDIVSRCSMPSSGVTKFTVHFLRDCYTEVVPVVQEFAFFGQFSVVADVVFIEHGLTCVASALELVVSSEFVR